MSADAYTRLTRYVGGHDDPPDPADVLAMQMVLRIEKATPPDRADLLTAAARSAALLCLDERTEGDGPWVVPMDAWCDARIRKIARRARGAQFEQPIHRIGAHEWYPRESQIPHQKKIARPTYKCLARDQHARTKQRPKQQRAKHIHRAPRKRQSVHMQIVARGKICCMAHDLRHAYEWQVNQNSGCAKSKRVISTEGRNPSKVTT